jgi:hypothetical protein
MINWGPWPGPQTGGGGGGGFFSTIYAAGVADVPSVDNLMTGTLQQFFINLGATPPPFPPTNPLFFPEAALTVGENPADSGVGADSKPLWRMRRWFSTFPSVGDQIHHETRYDLFGSGINAITGGDRSLHVLVDQFENRLTFEMDVSQLVRPGLFAPNIAPIYLDSAPVSYKTFVLLDALGSGNTNDWHLTSDGNLFRRALIPNVIGPGGGPAGPWSLIGTESSIWARNAGEPLVGSTLFYDLVSVQTFGVDDPTDQHTIVAQAAVLDAKNLGSGQAAGHGQTWIRSTLGGTLTLVASWFDDLVDIPVELITHNGAVFIGGATVDGTTSTTGTVNVGGDLNVGSGAAHLTTVSTDSVPLGAPITCALISGLVDLTTPSTDNALTTGIGGRFFLPTTARWLVPAGELDGTVTTGPTVNCGNNVAKTNILGSAVQLTAANCNTMNTNGLPNVAPAANTTNLTLQQLVDGSTTIKFDVTSGAVLNTATKLRAHLVLYGAWIP